MLNEKAYASWPSSMSHVEFQVNKSQKIADLKQFVKEIPKFQEQMNELAEHIRCVEVKYPSQLFTVMIRYRR